MTVVEPKALEQMLEGIHVGLEQWKSKQQKVWKP